MIDNMHLSEFILSPCDIRGQPLYLGGPRGYLALQLCQLPACQLLHLVRCHLSKCGMPRHCLALLSKLLVLDVLVADLLPDLVDALIMPPELRLQLLPLLLTLCEEVLRISE